MGTPVTTIGLFEVGFYGKLPSHGDFLRRRVSDAFVATWDGWLQESIAASRFELRDRWLDVYLTSPAWRFACAAGACGPAPVVGVMVPSVDRVGRYFPLTLVVELPPGTEPVTVASGSQDFLERAERLLIETLAADPVDFDRFEQHVLTLGHGMDPSRTAEPLVLDRTAAAVLGDDTRSSWQLPIGTVPSIGRVFEQLAAQRLSALYAPLVVWWSDGSSIVEPSCLISKGLPSASDFTALLDGSWSSHRWCAVPAHALVTTPIDDLVSEAMPPRFRSAGATDVGRVRQINQDAFIERGEIGAWAVADGLGGHSSGEVASRMVCDALADFTPAAGFEDMVDAARQRLADVNDALMHAAGHADGVRCGSTVAALFARGTRCAVLWAGDSRVYRFRDGELRQLTHDHSAEPPAAGGEHATNVITRAIGGDDVLLLDVYRDRVKAGDRFLLCSDGLTRVLPEARIRAWLECEDIAGAVAGLIAATLDAGAPDNVTVLLVDAFC